MKDKLYLVNPTNKTTAEVGPTTFSELKLKERYDLQEWLMDRPEVLGEPLLLITSEFDRFDRSDKRLDLLLLDRSARLVVAELKLDASGTLADQQAIRYAAFCSTMTMDDVTELYARRVGKNDEDALADIAEFVASGDASSLNGEPRIILAAGSFDDQELTSTVLWLRRFGVDITCVELTPYIYPGDNTHVLLVPRTLIPLAEARDYVVSVERKERAAIERRADTRFSDFFRQVLDSYAALGPSLPGPKNPPTQSWMQLTIGRGDVHYEWQIRVRTKFVAVAIHFENRTPEVNERRLRELLDACPRLAEGYTVEKEQGAWGKKGWTQFTLKVPFEGLMPDPEMATEAAQAMRDLVERTHGTLLALP